MYHCAHVQVHYCDTHSGALTAGDYDRLWRDNGARGSEGMFGAAFGHFGVELNKSFKKFCAYGP